MRERREGETNQQAVSAKRPVQGRPWADLCWTGPSAPGLLHGKCWALLGSAMSGGGSHIKAGRSDEGPVRHESGSRCSPAAVLHGKPHVDASARQGRVSSPWLCGVGSMRAGSRERSADEVRVS